MTPTLNLLEAKKMDVILRRENSLGAPIYRYIQRPHIIIDREFVEEVLGYCDEDTRPQLGEEVLLQISGRGRIVECRECGGTGKVIKR